MAYGVYLASSACTFTQSPPTPPILAWARSPPAPGGLALLNWLSSPKPRFGGGRGPLRGVARNPPPLPFFGSKGSDAIPPPQKQHTRNFTRAETGTTGNRDRKNRSAATLVPGAAVTATTLSHNGASPLSGDPTPVLPLLAIPLMRVPITS